MIIQASQNWVKFLILMKKIIKGQIRIYTLNALIGNAAVHTDAHYDFDTKSIYSLSCFLQLKIVILSKLTMLSGIAFACDKFSLFQAKEVFTFLFHDWRQTRHNLQQSHWGMFYDNIKW